MLEGSPAIPTDGWFKSSYSGANTTECVEAAFMLNGTAVRDSTDPHGTVLTFSRQAWTDFLAAVRLGKFR
ncbi:DUF397 domain-containing protein [Streptomyces sp. 7N604]|uniref:DUF397 domain-containing protein n=1 Tax=Streptomyces sp. 7N604 TaxID=3457415 RepID=UPI003FD4A507